jgi:hypothetical protein
MSCAQRVNDVPPKNANIPGDEGLELPVLMELHRRVRSANVLPPDPDLPARCKADRFRLRAETYAGDGALVRLLAQYVLDLNAQVFQLVKFDDLVRRAGLDQLGQEGLGAFAVWACSCQSLAVEEIPDVQYDLEKTTTWFLATVR